MNRIKHEVFISDESAKTYDIDALRNAVADGKPVGRLGVVVTRKSYRNTEGFFLTHERLLVVESGDQTADVDETIAADLGVLSRDDEVTGMKAGDEINLLYVLNHDGLPLSYNAAARDCFKKERSGRGANMNDIGHANLWMLGVDQARLISLLSSGGQKQIVEEWKAAGSPVPGATSPVE